MSSCENAGFPPAPPPPFRPHPFLWVPGAGERHASAIAARRHGEVVTSLCGNEIRADDSVLAWLWRTCPACDAEAHRLATRTAR
ncbi:zinc finger protein [Saccharopolyspora cebuensis]|uniref:Zinc finger protein n=1 Tax=Saccharopolyspora cebuensis TaxID=418759 RepID=A0ABV4CQ33_9PSEU